MSAAELMAHDLCAQAQLVREGAVSARELVQAAIERLERHGGPSALNVLVDAQFEQALAAADAHDGRKAHRPSGRGTGIAARAAGAAPAAGAATATPFAGVPFLLKDLGEPQAGRPERMGSRALREHVATETAETVRRYTAGGLIICGRTNTAEFGNHCATEPALFGPTLNPWNHTRSPGGSSGGSAAAVAAGLVGAASGGDGTGSIRMPAACCGLVGLKPRRGRHTTAPGGGVALDGLAVRHALTRTVRDSAALLDLTAGAAPGDPFPAPRLARTLTDELREPRLGGGFRIALAERPPFPGTVAPGVRAVLEAAARTLEELGHRVVPGAVADVDPEVLRRAIAVIHAVDNALTLGWLRELHGREPDPDELDPVTWEMAREGLALSAVEHATAVAEMHEQSRRAARLFETADVVLAPTLNETAPEPGRLSAARGTVDAFFDVEFSVTGWTALANATGWAAVSLPLGESEGMPVGVQLLAPEEPVLIRLAAQLELALPWDDRRPAEPSVLSP